MTGQKDDKEKPTQGNSVISTLHMSADRYISQGSSDRLSINMSNLYVSISNRTFNNNISGLAVNVSTDNIDINLLSDLWEPEKLQLEPTSGRGDENDSTGNIDINLLTDLRDPENLQLDQTSGRGDENALTDNIQINLLTDLREPEKLQLEPTSGRSDEND